MAKKKKPDKTKKYLTKLIIFAIFAFVFSGIFLFERQIYSYVNNIDIASYTQIKESDLLVHFIDVGQGDAIAINLPDNKTMLIDSGTGSSKENLTNYLKNDFFKQTQNLTFDYFLITHPHEDHIGGSVKIFEEFQINEFLRPEVYSPSEIEAFEQELGAELVEGMAEYNTQIFNNMITASKNEPNCQTLYFSFYNSPMEIIGDNYRLKIFVSMNINQNINNFSPIIVLESFGKKIVFTGDAESSVENEIVSSYYSDLNADVLKVGHHGSETSSTTNFLNAVSPSISVISVGKNNTYGHPKQVVLDKLQTMNSAIYRTDLNGSILVGVNDNSSILIFTTNGSNLPVKIEVWQIYLVGCGAAFYVIFALKFSTKRLKFS